MSCHTQSQQASCRTPPTSEAVRNDALVVAPEYTKNTDFCFEYVCHMSRGTHPTPSLPSHLDCLPRNSPLKNCKCLFASTLAVAHQVAWYVAESSACLASSLSLCPLCLSSLAALCTECATSIPRGQVGKCDLPVWCALRSSFFVRACGRTYDDGMVLCDTRGKYTLQKVVGFFVHSCTVLSRRCQIAASSQWLASLAPWISPKL